MSPDPQNLFGVALLTLLASLLVRRLGVSPRLTALAPILIACAINLLFVKPETIERALAFGVVSGLLAAGMLHVIIGLLYPRE